MQAAKAAATAASLAEAKRLAGVEKEKQDKLWLSAEQQVAAEATEKTAADAALVTAAEEVTAAEKAVATATTTATRLVRTHYASKALFEVQLVS